MNTISTQNETLTNMSENIAKAKIIRVTTVQSVIRDCIEAGKKNSELFTNKKNAIAYYIKSTVSGDVDNYTKRALKIAKLVLVDGYKIKRELLSLAQMEQLTKFNKNLVNQLMAKDGDEYITEVKNTINSAKIERKAKIFSAKKASKIQ